MAKNFTSENDLTWDVGDKFIPKFVRNDLKSYERDGIDTWYQQNKCSELINNADNYFKRMKIINFDLIKNDVPKEKLKQYQTLDHDKIKQYPPQLREQICSSIFRNSNRKDMHIQKATINEHFNNKKVCTGRGRLIKKIRDDMYAESWLFLYLYFNYLEKTTTNFLQYLWFYFFNFF